MTTLVVADDLIRASGVEHRQSRHLLLDRPYPGKERIGIRPDCALPRVDQHDLGLMLAGRESARPTGEGTVSRNTNTHFRYNHVRRHLSLTHALYTPS